MTQQPDDPTNLSAEDSAGEPLPLIELETLLARPPSRRKRLAQLGLVVAMLVVAAFTLRSVIVPAPSVASTPTPTLFVSSPSLVIESNLAFGTVTINGKRQDSAAPLLVAAHGDDYTITLAAPPFRPVSCHFTLSRLPTMGYFPPGACSGLKAGSAPGKSLGVMTVHGVTGFPSYALFLGVSWDDLLPDQQGQVAALLRQVLSTQSKLTIPAHAAIATRASANGTITSQRTAAPLQATTSLFPRASLTDPYHQFCQAQVCPVSSGPQFMAELHGPVWGIYVALALRWQFRSASGGVVSDVTYPTAGYANLFLSYSSANGWQMAEGPPMLAPSLPDQLALLPCEIGMALMQARFGDAWQISDLGAYGVQGCSLGFQRQQAMGQQEPARAHILWRFGVLLAADALTHALFPDLPVASPAEIAAPGK
ncbi:MAG TPA: hypothetical protein VH599_16805 [Ktedonobacterales bacterium]|jgi:hypothetical protein